MPARSDALAAPHADLLEMRRGTAHFARLLQNLSDAEISESATRQTIIAKISIDARTLALHAKSLREELTDEELNMDQDVAFAATLPVHALRYLFTHSALHLNVELRDLEDVHWASAAHIPRLRAQQIWGAAEALLHGQHEPLQNRSPKRS